MRIVDLSQVIDGKMLTFLSGKKILETAKGKKIDLNFQSSDHNSLGQGWFQHTDKLQDM